MRKIIGAMKISLDGKTEGPEGYADWVDAWSDDFGLTPPHLTPASLVAACTPTTSSTGPPFRTAPGGAEPKWASRSTGAESSGRSSAR